MGSTGFQTDNNKSKSVHPVKSSEVTKKKTVELITSGFLWSRLTIAFSLGKRNIKLIIKIEALRNKTSLEPDVHYKIVQKQFVLFS